MAKPSKSSKFNRNYFTLPHPFFMIIISFGIWLETMATIAPNSFPSYLGPIATFGKYMGTTYPNVCVSTCLFTVVAHALEAAFAGKLCHDRGFATGATIKWTLSTSLFGFSSLIRLVPLKPDYKLV